MFIFFAWIMFAVIVGVAANTRGRSGVGWFFLACLISPLIAGLFVLALPSKANEPGPINVSPEPESKVLPPGQAIFEPDGAFEGIPYRIEGDGTVDAIMQGARVKFRNLGQFQAAVGK